jgi:hypothetical protein
MNRYLHPWRTALSACKMGFNPGATTAAAVFAILWYDLPLCSCPGLFLAARTGNRDVTVTTPEALMLGTGLDAEQYAAHALGLMFIYKVCFHPIECSVISIF